MYNIFGYFKSNNTCNTQSGKLDGESYQYTTRDYVTIYFNNILASLSRSWREFKEEAYGFVYDIGAWLKETYENLIERPATHNHYAPKEKPPVKAEEIEMKELNRTFKPFQTPPIHPTIDVVQHLPKATQKR